MECLRFFSLLNLKQKLDSVKLKEKVNVPFHLKFIANGMFKVLFLLNLKQKLDSVKLKEKVKVPFHLKFITNGMFKVLFVVEIKTKIRFGKSKKNKSYFSFKIHNKLNV